MMPVERSYEPLSLPSGESSPGMAHGQASTHLPERLPPSCTYDCTCLSEGWTRCFSIRGHPQAPLFLPQEQRVAFWTAREKVALMEWRRCHPPSTRTWVHLNKSVSGFIHWLPPPHQPSALHIRREERTAVVFKSAGVP